MAAQPKPKPRRGRPRDPRRAEDRQERILEAAARFFAQFGYHGADVQQLADQLDVGKGTIYRYFATKEELFLAAVDRGMRGMRGHVDAACENIADPLEQIERAMAAYLEYFERNPQFVELLILERAVFKDRQTPTYFVHRERNVGRWRDLYRELIAAGRVRPMAVEHITNVISRALYGTMFTNFFAGSAVPFHEQARQLVDVLFNGILSDSERRRRASVTPAAQEWSR